MWHINAGPTFAIACFNGAWRSIQTSDGNILLIRQQVESHTKKACPHQDTLFCYL